MTLCYFVKIKIYIIIVAMVSTCAVDRLWEECDLLILTPNHTETPHLSSGMWMYFVHIIWEKNLNSYLSEIGETT